MTDQDKKSLRFFLKEMEDKRATYEKVKSEWAEPTHVHLAASAQACAVDSLIESFVERFSEDLGYDKRLDEGE